MLAQQAFSTFFFDVGMGSIQSFDVATGPAQTMPSCHALNFACGEHCISKQLLTVGGENRIESSS